MDSTRFDGLTRAVAARQTRRTGVALLAGACLALLGLVSGSDAKKKKITLCLNGQTVKKPKKRAKKLLKKGATRGACSGGCPASQKACANACIPVANCCVANDCTGDDVCENGACVPPRCGNGGPCVVFVSAGIPTASLGGIAGADNMCLFSAVLSPELAGKTFKAWISGNGETPLTRFTNTTAAGPYVLLGNADDNGGPPPTVAASFQDLIACDGSSPGFCLKHPINRDRTGSEDVFPFVWTGTRADGSAATDTCGDWQVDTGLGLVGEAAKSDTAWTSSTTRACDTVAAFYCFEQPR